MTRIAAAFLHDDLEAATARSAKWAAHIEVRKSGSAFWLHELVSLRNGMRFHFTPVGGEPLALNLRLVRSANAIRVPVPGAMENQRVILIKPETERKKSLPCGDTMMSSNLQCHDFSRFFLSPDSDIG